MNEDLLNELNGLEYYQKDSPKSLGLEWLLDEFYPILDKYDKESVENIICTIVEHESEQIRNMLKNYGLSDCLVTGGGAYNSFLIERLRIKNSTKIILPEKQIIEFKEALIFAFLAFLNVNNQINTFKSVTGAKTDSIGGNLCTPL